MRDYISPSLDTTISASGYMAYFFATHPDQWDLLLNTPELVPNAIEEVVRLTTPIRSFSRYVTEDTEISGTKIEKGSRVMVIYGSANRDETFWDEPDRFRQVAKLEAEEIKTRKELILGLVLVEDLHE